MRTRWNRAYGHCVTCKFILINERKSSSQAGGGYKSTLKKEKMCGCRHSVEHFHFTFPNKCSHGGSFVALVEWHLNCLQQHYTGLSTVIYTDITLSHSDMLRHSGCYKLDLKCVFFMLVCNKCSDSHQYQIWKWLCSCLDHYYPSFDKMLRNCSNKQRKESQGNTGLGWPRS